MTRRIESPASTPDRRRFLGFSLGAIAGSGLVGSTLFQGSPLLGEEPAGLPGRVKFSLAAYSYRNLLGGNSPELSMTEFIDDCARFGCDGTELTSYYMPADADDAYFHGLRRHAFRLGLDVSGTARVTCDDRVFLLSENQSTYIPIGTRHRLENPGAIPLEIIEVQSGSYLGEDDIVRFEDVYNRSGKKD